MKRKEISPEDVRIALTHPNLVFAYKDFVKRYVGADLEGKDFTQFTEEIWNRRDDEGALQIQQLEIRSLLRGELILGRGIDYLEEGGYGKSHISSVHAAVRLRRRGNLFGLIENFDIEKFLEVKIDVGLPSDYLFHCVPMEYEFVVPVLGG